MPNVLVIAELFEGKVRKGSLSAITFAREAAAIVGGGFDLLVLGPGAKAAAPSLAKYGAGKVLAGEAGEYVAEAYAPLVAKNAAGYAVVCATATAMGKDLMPRVAEHLKAGMASDVVKVANQGGLVLVRPMYAGNVLAHVKVKTPVAVVTVRQAEFEAAAETGGASPVADAAASPAEAAAARVAVAGFEKVVSARPELTDARVIVSGGRGLKSGDNFKIIEQLADLLHGAVGATRAAVDAGFVPNDLQVGQTGKIVAPQLYIAVGLSGALQHLAGMKGSKVIVAINKDPEAPIFTVADYGLVADLFQAVPALVTELKKVVA
ncbi:MAG: electron transfer flavoprotein subunit alpha/FixB family protein [Deltaproteobacteria bacterium]|nr:electron transfer flavoprotein subunit alpha/FixB family protein [Deltaproteobacteria bacterium]